MKGMNLQMRAAWKIRNREAGKRIAGAGLLALALAFAPIEQAGAAVGGVYVSTQGSDLGQAFGQALAENPAKAGTPFWIVITGSGVASMTRQGAGSEIVGWVNTVRARGGQVFVCRSDLVRARIKEDDLLDGVASVYGYGGGDWNGLLPARKEDITLPDNQKQGRLILKTCAEEERPAS